MPHPPALLLSSQRSIDRLPYLVIGAVLFLVKFIIDWLLATYVFRQSWSVMNYVIWPNDRTLRLWNLSDADRTFALAMLAVSVPFIWVGVVLTVQRLRATGLPMILVVFFFVPLVNLLLFLVLVVLPSRPQGAVAAAAGETLDTSFGLKALRRAHRNIAQGSQWRSGLLALAVSVPLSVLGVAFGAQVLESYGFGLFLGAPFALGMISVLLFGFSRPQPFGPCMGAAFSAGALAGLACLAVALEGAICLIMAAPIAFFLLFLGALVGYAIQSRPWLAEHGHLLTLAVVAALPALMAAEWAEGREPELRAVRTEIIIDAPPEHVWPLVIAFPPLPEPEEWLFQTGIAYPMRAEIHGHGVGAVRSCVFSTGAFIEPIDIWEEPYRLRFRVTEQPPPMREWSPYSIHPPHLDHHLMSHEGQFLLERLPDGRTRLEGTTWYTNRMWPAAYWNLWSDYIIHRIHLRVLRHIAEQI